MDAIQIKKYSQLIEQKSNREKNALVPNIVFYPQLNELDLIEVLAEEKETLDDLLYRHNKKTDMEVLRTTYLINPHLLKVEYLYKNQPVKIFKPLEEEEKEPRLW